MRLLAVGISHRTAPVELRECVDFARGGLDAALQALAARGVGARGGRALDVQPRRDLRRRRLRRRAAEASAASSASTTASIAGTMAPHLYTLSGADAARHLFRVAAGLDSLVVGEPQILGQVKDAYTAGERPAVHRRAANRLFHSAFTVGKRVRSETGLGEGAVSVSYAAIALAQEDLRRAQRPQRADPRRRRDGEADRHPPARRSRSGS